MSLVGRVLGADLSTKYETAKMAGLTGTIAGVAGMWGTGVGPMLGIAAAAGALSGVVVPVAQWAVTGGHRDTTWGKVSGYGLIAVATVLSYGQAHTISNGFAKVGLFGAPQSAPYVAPTDMVKNVGSTAALDTSPVVAAADAKPVEILSNSKAKVFPLSAINGANNSKTLLMYGAIYDAQGKVIKESLATLTSDGTMSVLDPAKNQMYMDYAALLRDNNRVDVIQNDAATNTRMYFFPDQNKVAIADNDTDMPNIVRTPTKADQDAIAKGPGNWKAQPLLPINDALHLGFGNSVNLPVSGLSDLYKQLFPNIVVVDEKAASLPKAGKPVGSPASDVAKTDTNVAPTTKTVTVDVSMLKGKAQTLSKNADGSVNFVVIDNANTAFGGMRNADGTVVWSNQPVNQDQLFLAQPGLKWQADHKLGLDSSDGMRGILLKTPDGKIRVAVENKKTHEIVELKPADYVLPQGYQTPRVGYMDFKSRGSTSNSDMVFKGAGEVQGLSIKDGQAQVTVNTGAMAVLLSKSADANGVAVEHYLARSSKGELQLIDSTLGADGKRTNVVSKEKPTADQALLLQPRLQSNPFVYSVNGQNLQMFVAYTVGDDGQTTMRVGRSDASGNVVLKAGAVKSDLQQRLHMESLIQGFKLVQPNAVDAKTLQTLQISAAETVTDYFHPAWQMLLGNQRTA